MVPCHASDGSSFNPSSVDGKLVILAIFLFVFQAVFWPAAPSVFITTKKRTSSDTLY